jgi:hypothetical protein
MVGRYSERIQRLNGYEVQRREAALSSLGEGKGKRKGLCCCLLTYWPVDI